MWPINPPNKEPKQRLKEHASSSGLKQVLALMSVTLRLNVPLNCTVHTLLAVVVAVLTRGNAGGKVL